MKKLVIIAMASILVLACSVVPSFADSTSFPAATYESVQGTSPQEGVSIPVYGYVGEDANIEDGEPPTVHTHAINVSVPTKVIWAAFESSGGAITSPDYHIKNNSNNNSLKVTLQSFTAQASSANDAVDGDLVLNIVGTDGQMDRDEVFNKGTGVTSNDTAFTDTFESEEQWGFKLGGTYDGDNFDTAYAPTYSMVLKFASAS
jgi:hypothetical protein